MKHQDMEVEVIYQQPDGSQVILGVRKLDGIPKIGKPFELDHRQYLAKSYSGPDATGRYRLFLEDEPEATRHWPEAARILASAAAAAQDFLMLTGSEASKRRRPPYGNTPRRRHPKVNARPINLYKCSPLTTSAANIATSPSSMKQTRAFSAANIIRSTSTAT